MDTIMFYVDKNCSLTTAGVNFLKNLRKGFFGVMNAIMLCMNKNSALAVAGVYSLEN